MKTAFRKRKEIIDKEINMFNEYVNKLRAEIVEMGRAAEFERNGKRAPLP
jgi:hypothetical protein